MTTHTPIIKTTALDSISNNLTIASNCTTLNVGTNNTVYVENVGNNKSIKQSIYYFSTQTFSPTISDFFQNGTFIIPTYSSANPSTVNDIITINLPVPTAELDGVVFLFRKLRGSANNTSTNWTFNCPSSLLTTTVPVSTLNLNPMIIRTYVLGFEGTYYYCIN